MILFFCKTKIGVHTTPNSCDNQYCVFAHGTNGGDLENMTAKLLEKHITDTIREWQVKIGYEGVR